MKQELAFFIEEVYREPYSFFSNNCINKSLKIKARAEELEERADLILCISILPIKKWHNFPLISPHVYTMVEGEKVDVSLDPEHETRYCKNSQKRLFLPVNTSRLRRTLAKGSNLRSWNKG